MDLLKAVSDKYLKEELPEMNVGDTVRVHVKIEEGSRERYPGIRRHHHRPQAWRHRRDHHGSPFELWRRLRKGVPGTLPVHRQGRDSSPR